MLCYSQNVEEYVTNFLQTITTLLMTLTERNKSLIRKPLLIILYQAFQHY